ncbi:MAG: hypothetical protein WA705_08900 [Candidatus Ozemobacteraceae bacterium]
MKNICYVILLSSIFLLFSNSMAIGRPPIKISKFKSLPMMSDLEAIEASKKIKRAEYVFSNPRLMNSFISTIFPKKRKGILFHGGSSGDGTSYLVKISPHWELSYSRSGEAFTEIAVKFKIREFFFQEKEDINNLIEKVEKTPPFSGDWWKYNDYTPAFLNYVKEIDPRLPDYFKIYCRGWRRDNPIGIEHVLDIEAPFKPKTWVLKINVRSDWNPNVKAVSPYGEIRKILFPKIGDIEKLREKLEKTSPFFGECWGYDRSSAPFLTPTFSKYLKEIDPRFSDFLERYLFGGSKNHCIIDNKYVLNIERHEDKTYSWILKISERSNWCPYEEVILPDFFQ